MTAAKRAVGGLKNGGLGRSAHGMDAVLTASHARLGNPVKIARWLQWVATLIVTIVVVGGVTRLTESGLSITQWKPLTGIVPPLNDAQWQAEFENYRQIDQYAAIHSTMTLAQFKCIFFWEYIHRVLGRVIGMAVLLPLAWYAWRRAIPSGYTWRLAGIVLLVGFQGLLGWLMVRSGLQPGMTFVAPGWLAAHLLTALLTLSVVVWVALDMRALERGETGSRLTTSAALVLAMLAVQLLYGALMAGLRAGYIASDWPLMQGKFYPAGVDWAQGALHAFLADPFLVHFIHRWWAWVVTAALIVMARWVRRAGSRPASIAIHSAFGTQLLLGIATVMTGMSLWVAALHQLVGALLVIATVWGAHVLGRPR